MEQQELHWSERARQETALQPISRVPAAAPAGRTRRRSGRTRLIVAVVTILIIAAAAITAVVVINQRNAAEARQQAVELAISQMTNYIDDQHNVMFRYPTSWTEIPVEELGGMSGSSTAFAAFGDPYSVKYGSTPSTYMVFAGQQSAGGADVSARYMLDETINIFDQFGGEGFSVYEGVRDVNTNGIRGAQAAIAYEDAIQSVVVRMCFLGEGQSFYVFMFGADESDWDENVHFFDATIESFVAGSA